MEKKDWWILIVALVLIILVVLFYDKLIIEKEEIIGIDYCEQNSDCTFAINPYNCCSCPIAVNKEVIDLEENYVIYSLDFDYSKYEKRENCAAVICLACEIYSNLSCVNNKCVGII